MCVCCIDDLSSSKILSVQSSVVDIITTVHIKPPDLTHCAWQASPPSAPSAKVFSLPPPPPRVATTVVLPAPVSVAALDTTCKRGRQCWYVWAWLVPLGTVSSRFPVLLPMAGFPSFERLMNVSLYTYNTHMYGSSPHSSIEEHLGWHLGHCEKCCKEHGTAGTPSRCWSHFLYVHAQKCCCCLVW